MEGMRCLGDKGIVASLDVTHVDNPGPFIFDYSAISDGWIAGKVEASKGGICRNAPRDTADKRVVATVECPVVEFIGLCFTHTITA